MILYSQILCSEFYVIAYLQMDCCANEHLTVAYTLYFSSMHRTVVPSVLF